MPQAPWIPVSCLLLQGALLQKWHWSVVLQISHPQWQLAGGTLHVGQCALDEQSQSGWFHPNRLLAISFRDTMWRKVSRILSRADVARGGWRQRLLFWIVASQFSTKTDNGHLDLSQARTHCESVNLQGRRQDLQTTQLALSKLKTIVQFGAGLQWPFFLSPVFSLFLLHSHS